MLAFTFALMTRPYFLSLLSLGTGAVLTGCLGGCKKDDTGPPANVDFTVDLNAPANAALATAGGYVYRGPNDSIIVARTTGGTYIAAARHCTHQQASLQFRGSSGVFHCPNHNAEFGPAGAVTRAPDSGSATSLKVYAVVQNGTTLRITG